MTPGLIRVGIVGSTETVRGIAEPLGTAGGFDVRCAAIGPTAPEAGNSIAALVAETDLVVTALPDGATLAAAAQRAATVLAGRRFGRAVLDFSAVAPRALREAAAVLLPCGIATIGGALVASEDGQTQVAYLDSEPPTPAAAQSVCAVLAAEVRASGAAGTAKTVAILDRLLLGVNSAAAAEAIALAARMGVAPEVIVPLLLKGSGASRAIRHRFAPSPADAPGRRVACSVDELRHALDLALTFARDLDHSLYFGAASLAAYRGASALGLGAADCSAAMRWYEHAANFRADAPAHARC